MTIHRKETSNSIWLTLFRVGRVAAISLLAVMLGETANASKIAPLYGNHAGSVGVVSMAQLQSGWVVTAVCNSKSDLELISWQDTGTALKRASSNTTTRNCWSVSITPFNSNTVVTLSLDLSTKNFEVSAWTVGASGAISQLGTTAEFAGSNNDQFFGVAQLDSTRVVTAYADVSLPQVTVTAWLVPSSGDISAEGSATTTTLDSVSICGLNSSQVVTAGTNSKGDLEMTAWGVDSSGNVTELGGASAGGVYGYMSIAQWTSNSVVTSLINGSQNLELISWDVSSTGTITRKATGTAGNGTWNAVGVIPTDNLPFTALWSTKGLSVGAWEQSGSSALKEFTAYNSTMRYYPNVVAGIGAHKIVTASISWTTGDLELEEWGLH